MTPQEPKYLEPRLEDSRRLQQMQDRDGYIIVACNHPAEIGEKLHMITRPAKRPGEKHEGICNLIAFAPATFEEFARQLNGWFEETPVLAAGLAHFRHGWYFYKTKAE